MRQILALVLVLAGLLPAQVKYLSGSLTWGTSDASASLRGRGNAITRDSAGTWFTISADSCSNWSPTGRGDFAPQDYDVEVSYVSRSSSGNTDSTLLKVYLDSRFCSNPTKSTGCEASVRAGRHAGTTEVPARDSLTTLAAATTAYRNLQMARVEGGNQIRACVDAQQVGGQSTDSTFWSNWTYRVKLNAPM